MKRVVLVGTLLVCCVACSCPHYVESVPVVNVQPSVDHVAIEYRDASKGNDGCRDDMVLVEGSGEIALRSSNGMLKVKRFCLDKTEVTVNSYTKCVRMHRCTAPDNYDRVCNFGIAGRTNHPINCVTHKQAESYCLFRGARLPTYVELQWASRSPLTKFPWGNEAPRGRVCWDGGEADQMTTCPVGSFPDGASPDGVLDLRGNVQEWTDDTWSDGGFLAVGGDSFCNNEECISKYAGFPAEEGRLDVGVGFRCAANASP